MFPSFLSLGIWVWITSARSSPEPFIDCTCYQNCEYKIIHIQLINFYCCWSQWWGLMTLACLWSLLPRNCLKQYTSRSWDGCRKEGCEGNLIFTQRVNIWSLKCLESRFCAQHPSRCFLALLDFVSAGQLSRSSTHVDTSVCQDKHTLQKNFRTGKWEKIKRAKIYVFLVINIKYSWVCDRCHTLNE